MRASETFGELRTLHTLSVPRVCVCVCDIKNRAQHMQKKKDHTHSDVRSIFFHTINYQHGRISLMAKQIITVNL